TTTGTSRWLVSSARSPGSCTDDDMTAGSVSRRGSRVPGYYNGGAETFLLEQREHCRSDVNRTLRSSERIGNNRCGPLPPADCTGSTWRPHTVVDRFNPPTLRLPQSGNRKDTGARWRGRRPAHPSVILVLLVVQVPTVGSISSSVATRTGMSRRWCSGSSSYIGCHQMASTNGATSNGHGSTRT